MLIARSAVKPDQVAQGFPQSALGKLGRTETA